ncbi:MAG: hypothetical protein ACFB13_09295, partial [Kiloniellaceae bacterium]
MTSALSAQTRSAQTRSARTRPRRLLLLFLVLASTFAAALALGTILAADGFSLLALAILVLFSTLFAWLTTSFWIFVIGFVVHLGAISRRGLHATAAVERLERPSTTALVMPIYNEDPARAVAGLKATLDSLCENDTSGGFDLFILSDTTDPDIWL